jgi:hypothetical protein
MRELTDSEIAIQDYVDNKVMDLIRDLSPIDATIHWDIEMIAEVRECIQYWIVDRLHICSEEEFYPFIET